MRDVIEVYKRISDACRKGKGLRLSWEEVSAIACDGAVQQAIDTADDEAREAEATEAYLP